MELVVSIENPAHLTPVLKIKIEGRIDEVEKVYQMLKEFCKNTGHELK